MLLLGICPDRRAVILNDEMDDFATPNVPDAFGLRPSPYNYPAAGKRPLSSTSPLVMDDEAGRTYLALGGSGGSRIFGAVAQVILNLDWGYDVANAIEQPRVHDQLSPAYVRRSCPLLGPALTCLDRYPSSRATRQISSRRSSPVGTTSLSLM